mmetsp:Transcript_115328/g.200101  ORF Transcript_115328/g.200101 Transcript_115328/m.200101 type:complete len:205 (-) Transcript_115328:268-882(-)
MPACFSSLLRMGGSAILVIASRQQAPACGDAGSANSTFAKTVRHARSLGSLRAFRSNSHCRQWIVRWRRRLQLRQLLRRHRSVQSATRVSFSTQIKQAGPVTFAAESRLQELRCGVAGNAIKTSASHAANASYRHRSAYWATSAPSSLPMKKAGYVTSVKKSRHVAQSYGPAVFVSRTSARAAVTMLRHRDHPSVLRAILASPS